MNIYDNMAAYLNSIYPVSPDMKSKIVDLFFQKTVNKNEFFLRAGENLREVGFINKGLFRYFYISPEGKESTKYFSCENNFVLSFAAFSGSPSPFFIQAVEDCELICIKTDLLKQLIDSSTDWLKVYSILLQGSYIEKEEREADFLFFNAAERYNKFVKNHPSLAKRIQQQHLASYLGITPVSLSRLLKKS